MKFLILTSVFISTFVNAQSFDLSLFQGDFRANCRDPHYYGIRDGKIKFTFDASTGALTSNGYGTLLEYDPSKTVFKYKACSATYVNSCLGYETVKVEREMFEDGFLTTLKDCNWLGCKINPRNLGLAYISHESLEVYGMFEDGKRGVPCELKRIE